MPATRSTDLDALLVSPSDAIHAAMQALDRSQKGIVLAVDPERRLVGAITDGDIRRAILAGLPLHEPLARLLERKRGTRYERPVTAPDDADDDRLLALLHEGEVEQLPLVDAAGRVTGLVRLADFIQPDDLPLQVVIMAGGFGARLRPLTEDTPKPMLAIAGRPLLERTIAQLRACGVRHINVTTHYLPEKITGYFGDGSAFGVALNYVAEDQPLGTAGALGLLAPGDQPLLVMNGDILTRVDYREMLEFHRQQGAELTVAVRQYDVKVPYGVVEAADGRVVRLREKPQYDFLVNAGIYVLEPSVRELIPPGQRCDMTDLIARLLDADRRVASFPIVEYWLDIGRHDDFERAQTDAQQMRWAA